MALRTDNFAKEISINGLAMQIAAQVEEIENSLTASVFICCDIYDGISINVSPNQYDTDDDPEVPATMALIRRHLGGKWEKTTSYGSFQLVRQLTDDWTITIGAPQKLVCTKRVVGTQTVTKTVATGYETQEVEEEVVEWDCPPSLLAR